MRQLGKTAVFFVCAATVPVVGLAQVAAPPVDALPLHPGYNGAFSAGPGPSNLRLDKTASDTVVGLTPHVSVGIWNGCAAGEQALCAMTFQLVGPCTASVSTTSTQPACLTILNTIYRAQIPTLPSPTISVDGAAVSNTTWRDRLGLLAISQFRPATAEECEQGAAARAVLERLYFLEAVATGRAASPEQVQAAIDHQVKAYQYMNKADRAEIGVPAGEDVATFYNSASKRLAFYHMLSTGNMRQVVAGNLQGAAADAAIKAWFRDALSRHVVNVSGLGTFALADALPNGL